MCSSDLIRTEINESTHRRKKSFLRREIEDTQAILNATGKEARFPVICAASLLLFTIGAAVAIIIGNFFLVLVLAVGMMFVPFWYIKLEDALEDALGKVHRRNTKDKKSAGDHAGAGD